MLRRQNLSYLRPIESGINNTSNEHTLFETTSLEADFRRCCYDESDIMDDGRCSVCEALWWDEKGDYHKYTDKSIGLTKWNHIGSGLLSLAILLCYLSLIICDAVLYGLRFWGDKKYLIVYMSYMSYLIFGSSIPLICTIALLNNAIVHPAPRFIQWPRALDIRYIVRRLQVLHLSERGLPNKIFLIICVGYPMGIAFYRLMFYVILVNSHYIQSYFSAATCFCVLTLYGVFSYMIYLLRISFHSQLKLDVTFITRHMGQLDVCRDKMASSVQEFRAMRQLTNGWMVMILAVLTWSVVTQVTWNYLLISGVVANKTTSAQLNKQMYVNGLMVMQNSMFFFLPCYAIGGFSMNEMWIRFRYRLFELRRARHERFWYRLLQFIREQQPVEHDTYLTIVFTLIGLFFGLQYGDQDVFYWNYNATDTSTTQSSDPAGVGGI